MDKNRIVGAAHRVKGAVKETVGKVTGDANDLVGRPWPLISGLDSRAGGRAPRERGSVGARLTPRASPWRSAHSS